MLLHLLLLVIPALVVPVKQAAEVDYPKCDDKADNVVRIFNSPGSENLPVQLSGNVAMSTYDANMRPSCNTTGGDITFPGEASLFHGTITNTQKIDARFVSMKLTMKKNDSDVGWLCINGEAQSDLVDNSFCVIDFCNYYDGVISAQKVCDMLTMPGVYNLEDKTPFPLFFFFNPIPYDYRNIMTGMWKISAALWLGDVPVFDWTLVGTDESGWVHITKTMVQ